MLKDKRTRPLFIKDNQGNIFQSFYVKNGLHFCKGYHVVLVENVVSESHSKEDFKEEINARH